MPPSSAGVFSQSLQSSVDQIFLVVLQPSQRAFRQFSSPILLLTLSIVISPRPSLMHPHSHPSARSLPHLLFRRQHQTNFSPTNLLLLTSSPLLYLNCMMAISMPISCYASPHISLYLRFSPIHLCPLPIGLTPSPIDSTPQLSPISSPFSI